MVDCDRSIERTLDFPAGIQKIIEMRGVLIEWEQLPAFLLTIRDITERKRTEAALQVTCEWLGIALRAAHAGTWDWDIPAGELEWSPEFFDLFGLSPGADPSFETWRATLHPDDREQATASINQSIREHSYLWNEYRIILPDGQVRWIGAGGSTTYAAGDEPVRMSGVCIDITDRKLAEQALRDSEKRYRDVVEDQTEFICRFTPDGILTFVNDAYCRYFGLKQDECIGKRHSVVIPPDDLDLMKEHIRSLTHENPAGFIEHRVIMPSGEVNWQYWSDRAIFGKDDHVAEYQSVGKDITKRKAAEEALQLTLSRLESAMEAGNIAWWEMDCTTGNVSFSERKARMLGYPAEQFSHYTDFTTLLHPDDSEPAMQAMRDHLSGLKKQYDGEYRIRTRDGRYRWFRDIGRISEYAPDGKPHKVTGLVIDISERKRAETAQIKTTRKLNVLSDLTRKDLTSQIFVLDGYLNLAKKHAVDQDQVITMLSKGEPALRSIHEIIEYTKDYQDMGVKPATWQNLNLALLLGLSHVSIGEIQHSLETENLEIFADPLLEKVCQCLFENSLAHGGHVTRIRVWRTTTPGGITILFEDDGVGIPQEKKEQIFLGGDDTTRFSLRSLIFVREILDITGITIRETGEPGKGARFEIMVPDGAWRMTGESD